VLTSVAGRTALVTGGTRGIGSGVARVLAEAGANVVVTGRDAAAGSVAERELSGLTGTVAYERGDTSREDDCARVVEAAVARHGGLDIVVANAGIYPGAAIPDLTAAAIDETLATNVRGTILIVRAALGALTRSGHGRVIAISSITGPLTGQPGWSHYGASKAAQLGFVRSAAVELAVYGITVNAVLPGNIATGDEGQADQEREMIPAIPLGRLGRTDEIGHACLFLASDGAAYITGQTIVVDGGQTLPESLHAVAPREP
jgi:3-oxoacyl-[acyl-carrier protein] reductase